MAREGITDLHAGHEAFITALRNYHEGKSHFLGLSFDDYIAEKVAIKGRLFNSILNGRTAAEIQNQVEKYRKQSDGE